MLLRLLARRVSAVTAQSSCACRLNETQLARSLQAASHPAFTPPYYLPSCDPLGELSQCVPIATFHRPFCASSSKGGDITTDAPTGIPTDAPTKTIDGQTGQTEGDPSSQTLMNALDKLVSAAADFVEEGKLAEAISVLTEGIRVLEGPFPNSTEVGELHNQVALLLLFSDKALEAEQHVVRAHQITQEVFGPTHILTAKRMLRLGAVLTALGKTEDAFTLLSNAKRLLQVEPMKFAVDIAETDFFTALLKQSTATSATEVLDHQPELFSSFKILCDNVGAASLTVSIALGQQSRTTLNALEGDFQTAEALFKQEIRLLESCGTHQEAVGLTLYKLATFYYANDLFHDGTEVLQKSTSVLRNVLPDDHDLLVLCKHRQGMLCALGGDHRVANKLLKDAQGHFSKLDPNHVLALEASAGLELARLRELDIVVHTSVQEMTEVLNKAANLTNDMSLQIGANHMLVRALNRRLDQLRYSLDHR